MSKIAELEPQVGEIKFVGRLDGKDGPEAVSSPSAIWTGTISAEYPRLKPRLGFSSENEFHGWLENYKQLASDYYKKITPGAHVRCIDGRPKKGTLQAEHEDVANAVIGPQTPGGSPAATVAHRIAEFDSLPPGNNIIDDLSLTIEKYIAAGQEIPVGAHDDDRAQFPYTGCGAIDKLIEITDRLARPEAGTLIKDYVEAITTEDFTKEDFEIVLKRYRKFNQPKYKDQYLGKNSEGEYQYRGATLEAIEEVSRDIHGSPNIECMEGDHREVLLIINKVKGSTFHRDLFCKNNLNEAQVFNYDYWQSLERANALYIDNPSARRQFLIARAMYGVGTAMVLTDGSLGLGIREVGDVQSNS